VTWTLHIPVAIVSANRLKRRSGRYLYPATRKAFAKAIHVRAHERELIPRATGKRRVHIDRLYWGTGKEMDHDNLVFGCKPLLDELVKRGLLIDDAPAYCEVTYRQERVGEKSSNPTIVTLEDCEEVPMPKTEKAKSTRNRGARTPTRQMPSPLAPSMSEPRRKGKRQPELSGFERPTNAELERIIDELKTAEEERKAHAEAEKALREEGIAELTRQGLDSYTQVDGEMRYTLRRQESAKIVFERVKVRPRDAEDLL
jgi:hypothetical protein